MRNGSLDGREEGERCGDGFVEISEQSAMQVTMFLGSSPPEGIQYICE